MRIIILAIACMVLINPISAQLSKGQKMIGGELSFSDKHQNYSGLFGPSKSTALGIAPQFIYGLSKNWSAGAGVAYVHQSSKSEAANSFTKFKENIYTFSLLVRRSHPFTDKMGIYGQLDMGVGFGKGEQKQGQGNVTFVVYEAKVTTISPMLHPGFYFKPTKRLIIEAVFGGIGYLHSKTKPDSGIDLISKEFTFTLTSSFGLAFAIVF